MGNDRRQRRDYQNNMTQECKADGELDGLESTQEFIGNPGTQDRRHVAPESIDYPMSFG